jgi:hypothetical protein
MGLEIAKVINRFTKKDETILRIPDDKDGFFKYLSTSIEREKKAFYRDYNENDTIKIPKEKKRKLREVKESLRMKESQLGRKLTVDESRLCISKWFNEQEYLDLLNSINVGSISATRSNGDSETDALNYIDPLSTDPLDEYIKKNDMETIRKIVNFLLEQKQERSRDCYRALFTLYCIENYKDFEKLYPVLNSKMMEIWQKDKKKPSQYEIYQIYHPNAQKNSADAMASKNLHEFLIDIETFLKKNQ